MTSIYVPAAYNTQGTTVPCDNIIIGFINDEAPKNIMIHSVALLLFLFVALILCIRILLKGKDEAPEFCGWHLHV